MAAAADAALSSFLNISTFRFPNTLLTSSPSPSSLRLLAASHFSVPLSVSHRHRPLSPLIPPHFPRTKKTLAVSGGEESTAVATVVAENPDEGGVGEESTAVATVVAENPDEGGVAEERKAPSRRPCELYVCNLPRGCDIAQLLDLFKPHGTVLSVEVSRDSETGLSRGCGYVTMSSMQEAKAAIAALDGSDLGGREMRVKYSAEMTSGRTNIEALNTAPKKNMVFESPHKAYVGNLAWSVRPEDLREFFSQFGTVVSTRVLFDRKGGRNRVYGFISFSSSDELKAAMKKNGSAFHGRTLVMKEITNREVI